MLQFQLTNTCMFRVLCGCCRFHVVLDMFAISRGIDKYKIWASEDKNNWWVVREGEFPAYGPNVACGDQKTYTVNIGNEPKRYIWVEGLKNWGNGGGLAFFGVTKSQSLTI